MKETPTYISRRMQRGDLVEELGTEWWIEQMFARGEADGFFVVTSDEHVIVRYYKPPRQELVIETRFSRLGNNVEIH